MARNPISPPGAPFERIGWSPRPYDVSSAPPSPGGKFEEVKSELDGLDPVG